MVPRLAEPRGRRVQVQRDNAIRLMVAAEQVRLNHSDLPGPRTEGVRAPLRRLLLHEPVLRQ